MEETSIKTPTEFKNTLINEMFQKYRNKKMQSFMTNGILKLLHKNENLSPKIKPIYTKNENNQNNSKRIKQYEHKPSFKQLNLLHSYNSHSNILNKQKGYYQTHCKMLSFNKKNYDSEHDISSLPKLFENNRFHDKVINFEKKVFTPKLKGLKYKINHHSRTIEEINSVHKGRNDDNNTNNTNKSNIVKHYLKFILFRGKSTENVWDDGKNDNCNTSKKMNNKKKFYFYLRNKSLQNTLGYY